MIRLFEKLGLDASKLIAATIHRPARRSYSTWGSVTSCPLRTELQNVASSTFSPPRLPCLSNTLIHPLTATRTWVGPTDPPESGGTKPDSLSCAPRNEVPAENGVFGPVGALAVAGAGVVEALERFDRAGSSPGRGAICTALSPSRPPSRLSLRCWRAVSWEMLCLIPREPAHG